MHSQERDGSLQITQKTYCGEYRHDFTKISGLNVYRDAAAQLSHATNVTYATCIIDRTRPGQTWGESTFNDSESESDSGRLFDSESDSSQFGYDSESNSDSSNISISDSESDSNFQLLI